MPPQMIPVTTRFHPNTLAALRRLGRVPRSARSLPRGSFHPRKYSTSEMIRLAVNLGLDVLDNEEPIELLEKHTCQPSTHNRPKTWDGRAIA